MMATRTRKSGVGGEGIGDGRALSGWVNCLDRDGRALVYRNAVVG